MLNKIGLWLFTRLFQVTSLGSYAVAIWAWAGFQPGSEGISLLETALKALLALLLFCVNEKPWIKKISG